jgi:hypothetical protein
MKKKFVFKNTIPGFPFNKGDELRYDQERDMLSFEGKFFFDRDMALKIGLVEETISITGPFRVGEWFAFPCVQDSCGQAISIVASDVSKDRKAEICKMIADAMNFDVKKFAFAFANHVVSPNVKDEIQHSRDISWIDWILDRVELAMKEINELEVLRAQCGRARGSAENTPTPHRLGRDDIKEKKEFS